MSFSLISLTILLAQDKGFDLRRQYHLGDRAEYKLVYDGLLGSATLKVTGMVKEQVVKIVGNTVSLESLSSGVVVTYDGAVSPPQADSKDTYSVSKDGSGLQLEPGAELWKWEQVLLTHFDPPQTNVKEGDSWKLSFKVVSGSETLSATVNYKFLGYENQKGVQLNKVAYEVEEKGAKLPISFKGAMWLEQRSNVVFKIDGKAVNMPFDGGIAVEGSGNLTLQMTEFEAGSGPQH